MVQLTMARCSPMVLLLAAAVSVPGPLAGQTVGYSVTLTQLTELDLDNGDYTVVGAPGTSSVGGLAMAPDGSLFSASYFADDLWRIDPATGDSTRIGPLGVAADVDMGLTFDACGNLWMVSNRRLYTVDTATGSATLVSELGEEIMGLTARGETLLALVAVGFPNQLATIDPKTGTLSLFGDFVYLPTLQQGLDFDAQGRLWGTFWMDGPIPGPWVSSIVRYDPTTGEVLSILEFPAAQNDFVLGGNLAITPPQGVCGVVAIPSSSPFSLVALTLLLAAAGLLVVGRFR